MSTPLPLHPSIVHMPLALAVLVPAIALAALLAWWRGWLPGRRVWVVVFALQAGLTLSAWAALSTGQAEEERVEGVLSETALEAHEEAAELFLGVAAGTLVLTFLALVVPGAGGPRLLASLALAGMILTTVLAFRVGEAGGELVYRHGAASAYTSASTPPARSMQEDDD